MKDISPFTDIMIEALCDSTIEWKPTELFKDIYVGVKDGTSFMGQFAEGELLCSFTRSNGVTASAFIKETCPDYDLIMALWNRRVVNKNS